MLWILPTKVGLRPSLQGCVDRSGRTTVLAASKTFEKLAENQLDDEFVASPAVSQGRIYLRGRKSLYAIGGE